MFKVIKTYKIMCDFCDEYKAVTTDEDIKSIKEVRARLFLGWGMTEIRGATEPFVYRCFCPEHLHLFKTKIQIDCAQKYMCIILKEPN